MFAVRIRSTFCRNFNPSCIYFSFQTKQYLKISKNRSLSNISLQIPFIFSFVSTLYHFILINFMKLSIDKLAKCNYNQKQVQQLHIIKTMKRRVGTENLHRESRQLKRDKSFLYRTWSRSRAPTRFSDRLRRDPPVKAAGYHRNFMFRRTCRGHFREVVTNLGGITKAFLLSSLD